MTDKMKERNIEGYAIKTEQQFETKDFAKIKIEQPLFHKNVSTLNVANKPNSSRCKAIDKECDTCGKRFKSHNQLKIHLRIHSGEKPFSCKTCFISFSTSSYLKVHERSIHDGNWPFKCDVCDKRFANKYQKIRHKIVHSYKPGFVKQIKNIGKEKDSGETHKNGKLQLDKDKFKCEICSKNFNFRQGFMSHRMTHDDNAKKFKCKICHKAFADAAKLRRHENIHTNEKSYKCNTCGKHFNVLSNLHRHEKIHTGEKNFECLSCGKRFIQSNQLNVHEKTHTQDRKIIKCEKCEATFTTKYYLKIHKERYHTNEKTFQCAFC